MKRRKIRLSMVLCYFTLMILVIVALFPIYWMINTSFKTDSEIYSRVPTFYPHNFTLTGWRTLLKTNFPRSLMNSFKVAMSVSIFTIFICMLGSYSISRTNVVGRSIMSRGVLYTYLLPRTMLFIPLYMLASKLKLTNKLFGLGLLYLTFTVPYAMWMLIAYFKTIPKEIEEAAKIDGCSLFQQMFKVFFPMAVPGIVSTFIFCFTLCWNEYLYSLIMVNRSKFKTFPTMLTELIQDDIFA